MHPGRGESVCAIVVSTCTDLYTWYVHICIPVNDRIITDGVSLQNNIISVLKVHSQKSDQIWFHLLAYTTMPWSISRNRNHHSPGKNVLLKIEYSLYFIAHDTMICEWLSCMKNQHTPYYVWYNWTALQTSCQAFQDYAMLVCLCSRFSNHLGSWYQIHMCTCTCIHLFNPLMTRYDIMWPRYPFTSDSELSYLHETTQVQGERLWTDNSEWHAKWLCDVCRMTISVWQIRAEEVSRNESLIELRFSAKSLDKKVL